MNFTNLLILAILRSVGTRSQIPVAVGIRLATKMQQDGPSPSVARQPSESPPVSSAV